jgi:hypothetical protein
LIFLSGATCSKVKIADPEWCGDIGKWGAECVQSFDKTKGRSLTKPEWDKIRIGWMCTKHESVSNWAGAITKLCADTRYCTKEIKEKINNLNSNLEKIKKKTGVSE